MSSVPVSQYEALRAEMRSLVQQAQQVQQIATQVISTTSVTASTSTSSTNYQVGQDEVTNYINNQPLDFMMESLVLENIQHKPPSILKYEGGARAEGEIADEECGRVSHTPMSVSSEPILQSNRPMNSLYHGTWPVERTMWNIEPSSSDHERAHSNHHNMDQTSVLSFASSSGGAPLDRVLGSPDRLSRRSMQQLEAKVDMVYSLLSMLGGQEHADMGDTLLALSTSSESCLAMRQSGCIPLLVQLVQSDKDPETRKKASEALHNLVHAQPDERLRKRETRVLKLLEQARAYTEALKNNTDYEQDISSSMENQENQENDKHPVPVIAHLMKLSFDEGHRMAICQLGGIHIIASLVETEHTLHGSTTDLLWCVLMRRYACMALTNLTFGDSGNKALLCSFREFMRALVVQLQSPSDELRQVTASVLRNLSWRADPTSKEILREVGTVTGLMKAGMLTTKENTLKSILSALWNLSAHCTENKLEICAVEGGLGFLIDMLSYKAPSKSLTINENSGGILRNISSQIAVRDDYREILRTYNCLQILLEQLKSPSLTIVSNACGTLWNLSAKNSLDQEALWQMGAPTMLRSLNHSKHKMIATGSSAALKNLLNSRPSHSLLPQTDSTARAMDLPALPTLGARKQKALMHDLDQNLSETFENIERDSPTKLSMDEKMLFERTEKYVPGNNFMHKRNKSSKHVVRSESHEFSTHTELVYETRSSQSEASNQTDLCNGFSSLNINEPSTSYQKELRNSSGNFGNSSLVYQLMPSHRKAPGTFIPVRNKYADTYPDDTDTCEQPIDYSRKYSETKLPTNAAKTYTSSTKEIETPETIQTQSTEFQFTSTNSSSPKVPSKHATNFGIYAETDLDQPTDYSLRYAEDDSDSNSDICDKISKDGSEYVQDTIKTYFTEGTPYETPINFSTATSMSDLRLENEKSVIDNDKNKDKSKAKIPTLSHLDEKDQCSTEDISDLECRPKLNPKNITSELSSGLMSPEKPIKYSEEGTPGYFSRVSSFGSLNSIVVSENIKLEENVEKCTEPGDEEKEKNSEEKGSPGEAKAVKFVEQVVNYAEQTPLMFSRSSSLASLDSAEQHSIHDDLSSVISDFSRLTSGIVSPSELPDSPTQTVPPSPRPRKAPLEYPSTSRGRTSEGRPQPAPRSIQKTSVFEDNITKFKEESTPVQFSTATSISSITIDDDLICGDIKELCINTTILAASASDKEEELEKQDTEQEKRNSSSELNEEQLSDEDDVMLADCINIGMQNNRHRQLNASPRSPSKIPSSSYKPIHRAPLGRGLPLPRTGIPTRCAAGTSRLPMKTEMHSDTVHTYYTEDTPAILSHAGSNSDLSILSIPQDNKSKKDYLSDDSSNLSGDNENILAECIQSGMPKAKTSKDKKLDVTCGSSRNIQTSTPIKPFARNDGLMEDDDKKRNLHQYLSSKDEVASFAVENSPSQFSLGSSLSDLTVDGSLAGIKRNMGQGELASRNHSYFTGSNNNEAGLSVHNSSANNDPVLSRQESLSSLSVESYGSVDGEQALLEQCISSGMPKSKHNVTPNKVQEKEKPVGVATKQFSRHKTYETEQCRRIHMEKENDALPKNGNVASAVGNINPISPGIPSTAADVINIIEDSEKTSPMEMEAGTTLQRDMLQVKSSHTAENLLTDLTKSGCEKSLGKILDNSFSNSSYSNSDNCANLEVEIEPKVTRSIVDNRMLDPDAMIESLDRFTAELVSQASSHLQNKEENKYTASVTEGDTWNDDISPNDLTFPSISGSAPNVITFESEAIKCVDEATIDEPDGIVETEHKSNDFSSLNTSTLTESTLIAMEATKMATTFKNEAELSQSITSIASLELDQIQPPSQMNSITCNGFEMERAKYSPKLPKRKRSLPAGLLARRALTNSLNQGSSLESLENNSVSNLDQVNPPSAMADMIDMEGSMISVASISSEIADVKADFQMNGLVTNDKFQQPNPIFNVKQPANMLHLLLTSSCNMNSLSDLDNVNPPSLFNEITDMCNSLADIATDNICTETDVFEDCNTNNETLKTENDVTEFSDANSITPIQSDSNSSPENTPKKVKSVSKNLTPKQRRNLAKERYKTYTVAAEMVMREEEQKLIDVDDITLTEDFKSVDCSSDTYNTVAEYSTATYTRSPNKVTPKERRQNDRSRFETQVLDKATIADTLKAIVSDESPSSSPTQSPARSRISIRKKFVQKRLENQDRFKTQTITESSISPEILSESPTPNSNDEYYLVQKEANAVLKTLRETTSRPDDILDCETLSLVSNDDDSEHNSGSSMNYRTYHKSWGLSTSGNIPVIQATVPNRKLSDLENYPGNLSKDRNGDNSSFDCSEDEHEKQPGKSKIVKPKKVNVPEDLNNEDDIQGKGIRGRRKPLYSKANANNKMPQRSVRPIKAVTSNLLKNVTSTLKSGTQLKTVTTRQNKPIIAKPPIIPQTKGIKPPANYNKTTSPRYGSNSTSPKGSPIRTINTKHQPESSTTVMTKTLAPPVPLERQGTFTKDEKSVKTSKIPTVASAIPKPSPTSRIAKAFSQSSVAKTVKNIVAPKRTKNGLMKSASMDRATKTSPNRLYNRSPSADGRDSISKTSMQSSTSNKNLKSGAVKRPQPDTAQKSNSNSSIASNPSSKLITSKIASLWKRVEESKKQPPKKDMRVWIQTKKDDAQVTTADENSHLVDVVVLRDKHEVDECKRVSRLGSFLVMDEDEINCTNESF